LFAEPDFFKLIIYLSAQMTINYFKK
jgi:hypothetical protein